MPRTRISKKKKELVAKRARYYCEYCLHPRKYSHDSFAAEHFIPVTKNGTDDISNLAYSCQGCNSFKYNFVSSVDPVTGQKVALYHPRKEQWEDHFCWNPDFSEMIGITPAGRATIARLRLNRDGLVNLRKVMYLANEHPPEY